MPTKNCDKHVGVSISYDIKKHDECPLCRAILVAEESIKRLDQVRNALENAQRRGKTPDR